jgi:hypothetical protein
MTSDTLKNHTTSPDADEPVRVTTANLEYLDSGDSYCDIFPDGTIQYDGDCDWQKSERREFMGDQEPERIGGSALKVEVYESVMGRLKEAM